MAIEDYEELKICPMLNLTQIDWSAPLLTANFGAGFGAGALTAPAAGLHKWTLSANLLPDTGEHSIDYEIDGDPFSSPRFTYLFEFIKRHIALNNKPFIIRDPRTENKYLVSFDTSNFSFSALTAKIFSGGIMLIQRRSEDLDFNADGSIDLIVKPPLLDTMIAAWEVGDILGAADGDLIDLFTSVYGNPYAISASGGLRPTYKNAAGFTANGRPCLLFNEAHGMQGAFGETYDQPFTLYLVASIDTTNAQVLAAGDDGVNNMSIYCVDGKIKSYNRDTDTYVDTLTQALPMVTARLAFRIDGADSKAFKNGVGGTTFDNGTAAIDGFTIGTYYGLNAVFMGGKYYAALLYEGAHTDEQIAAVDSYLKQKYMGETLPQVVAVGDSMTEGYLLSNPATESYTGQLQTLLGSGWNTFNTGISGYRLDQILTNAQRKAFDLNRDTRSQNIMILQGGFNDLYQGTAFATVQSRFEALYEAAVAAGFTPVVIPLPPSVYAGTPSTYMARSGDLTLGDMHLFNEWLEATYPTEYVGAIAADANVGETANTGNSTYFYDDLHLKAAGYAIYAAHIAAKINSL